MLVMVPSAQLRELPSTSSAGDGSQCSTKSAALHVLSRLWFPVLNQESCLARPQLVMVPSVQPRELPSTFSAGDGSQCSTKRAT